MTDRQAKVTKRHLANEVRMALGAGRFSRHRTVEINMMDLDSLGYGPIKSLAEEADVLDDCCQRVVLCDVLTRHGVAHDADGKVGDLVRLAVDRIGADFPLTCGLQ